MIFYKVFKALSKAKVKYVVAGGVAVVLHGYPRLTRDLDLIVLLEEKNLDRFFEALRSIGYNPKVPVSKQQFKDKKERERWKREKGMIVFSFVQNDPPNHLIDMFVGEPIRFDFVYRDKKIINISGVKVPLISIHHLKRLKLLAGRDVDLIDVEQLKAIEKMMKK